MSSIGGATADLGELKVRLTAETSKLIAGLKRAQEKLEKFKKVADEIALESGVAFAALALGLKKLADVTGKQETAERKLAVAIKSTKSAIDPQAIKEYAASLQQVTTFGDELTIESAAMLTTFGLTQDQLKRLIVTSQDMSAMYGVALPQAAKTLGRSLAQGAGALTEYGITLTKAQIESFNLANKTERVNKLVQIFASVAGGAAVAQADTFVGSVKQLGNAFGDLLEMVGKIASISLIPVMRSTKTGLEGAIDVFGRLQPWVKETLSMLGSGSVLLVGAVAGVSILAAGFARLSKALITLSTVFLRFIPILIPAMPMILGISAAVVGLIALVGAMRRVWEKHGDAIKDKLASIKDVAINAFNAVKTGITKTFASIRDIAIKVLDWVTEKIVNAIAFWESLFNQIKGFVKGKGFELDVVFSDATEKTVKRLARLKELGGGSVGIGGLTGPANRLKKLAEPIVDAISKGLDKVKKDIAGLGTFEDFKTGFMKVSQPFIDGFKQFGSDFMLGLDTIKGLFIKDPEARAPAAPMLSQAASDFVSDFSKGIKMASEIITGAISENAPILASTIDVGLKAFAQGGPIAAIIAIVANLLSKTRAFAEIMSALEGVVGSILEIISAAIEPIADAVKVIAQLISRWLSVITKVIEMLNKISGAGIVGKILGKVLPEETERIAESLRSAGEILSQTVSQLSEILGVQTQELIAKASIEQLTTMFDKAGPELQAAIERELQNRLDAALLTKQFLEAQTSVNEEVEAEIEKLRADLKRHDTPRDMIDDIVNNVREFFDQKLAEDIAKVDTSVDLLTNFFDRLGGSTEDLAENVEKVNEELLNVPTGFKVALSRFRAIEADAIATPLVSKPIIGARASEPLSGVLKPITSPTTGRSMFDSRTSVTTSGEPTPMTHEQAGIIIDTLNIGSVQANDTTELVTSIEEEATWTETTSSGTRPSTSVAPNAVTLGAPIRRIPNSP